MDGGSACLGIQDGGGYTRSIHSSTTESALAPCTSSREPDQLCRIVYVCSVDPLPPFRTPAPGCRRPRVPGQACAGSPSRRGRSRRRRVGSTSSDAEDSEDCGGWALSRRSREDERYSLVKLQYCSVVCSSTSCGWPPHAASHHPSLCRCCPGGTPKIQVPGTCSVSVPQVRRQPCSGDSD